MIFYILDFFFQIHSFTFIFFNIFYFFNFNTECANFLDNICELWSLLQFTHRNFEQIIYVLSFYNKILFLYITFVKTEAVEEILIQNQYNFF